MSSGSVLLYPPPGYSGILQGPSGTTYRVVSGQSVVVQQGDLTFLLNKNFTAAPPYASIANPAAADGLYPTALSLLDGKNTNGTPFVSSGASTGSFNIYVNNISHIIALATINAQGATVTGVALYDFILPPWYVAGQNINLIAYAYYAGTGVAGACTVAATAYLTQSNGGVSSANLISTAAQNINTVGAPYTFAIPGATLTPGARLLVYITLSIQETGGTNTLNGYLSSVQIA